MQISYRYIFHEEKELYFDYIGNREEMNRILHDLLVLLLEPSDQFDLDYMVYTYTITEGPAIIVEEGWPSDQLEEADRKEGEADV